MEDMRLEFEDEKLVYDCWEHKALGCLKSLEMTDMMPHSAEVVYACNLPGEARAVFSDCNIFAGRGLFESSLKGEFLEINIKEEFMYCPRHGIYVYLPCGAVLDEGMEVCSGEWGSLVRFEVGSRRLLRIKIA